MTVAATGIRHATASAIVLDDDGRVLLVEHHEVGLWLYPGGQVDANEDRPRPPSARCSRRPVSI